MNFGEHYKYSDPEETQEYEYTVELVNDIDNFTKIDQAHYKYTSPKINITIEKNWVDGSVLVPDTIDAKLKRNGSDFRDITLTETAGWSLLVEDLDQADSTGSDYTYTVEEITQIEGFTSSVENFVITNTYASPTIDYTETVIINGGINAMPETIKVDLYKDGVKTTESKNIPKSEFTNGSKEVTFENVDKTDNDGNMHSYDIKISEDNELAEGFTIDDDGNVTYTIPTHEVNATVNYVNGENVRQDVLVQAMQNGHSVSSETISASSFDDNTETVTFTVNKTDAQGNTLNTTFNFPDITGFTKAENSTNEVTYTYVVQSNASVSKDITISEIPDPITITVKLIRNGAETGQTKEITIGGSAGTSKTAEWNNLAETSTSGEEYNYEIKMDETSLPEGYTYEEGSDGNISITYAPEQITKDATVKFVNGQNARQQVTVKLKKNGSDFREITLSNSQIENDSTTVTFNNLPKTDQSGSNYAYTYEFGDIANFSKGVNGNIVTYTYNIPTTSFTKQTTRNNGKAIEIVVDLTRNGSKVAGQSKTITLGQAATWNNLDKTDNLGNNYTYDAEINLAETNLPDGYTAEEDEDGNIVVTYRSPKINITIEKNWVNGSELVPENVQVQLKRNGANFRTLTVTKASGWNLVVEDLDKTDSNADDYTYTVEEITQIEGFTGTVENFVITNTYVSPTIDYTETVTIGGGINAMPETIKVDLYKDGVKTGESKNIPKSEFTNGSKEVTFENVDKTDNDGNTYNYNIKVSEDNELPEGFTIDDDGNITYTIPTHEVNATVNYVNGENVRQSVNVKAMQNGAEVDNEIISTNRFDDNTETVTFTVNKTDAQGNTVNTTFSFPDISGFTKSNDSANEVTYTYVVPSNASVSKTIKVDSSVTEAVTITVKLIKNGQATGDTKEVVLGGSNGNQKDVSWENLESTDEQGNNNIYSIAVDNVSLPEGYNAVTNGDGSITVKYNPDLREESVNVEFVNGNSVRKPVTVTLKQNGTEYNSVTLDQERVSNNDTIPVVFTDLPRTDQSGDEYTYTYEYSDVEGFSKEITATGVIYTYNVPRASFTKQTTRNNGKAIEIVVDLTRNGSKVAGESKTITLGESATWNNLDKTDNQGNDYTYDAEINLAETDLPDGYTAQDDGNGNIAVTYTSPKMNITIEKNWEGGDELVPENVQVQLKRNGVNFRTLTVTKASGWNLLVEDLDKTDSNADDYTYTVEEITQIEGFTGTVENFVITNTYASPSMDYTETVTIDSGLEALPETIKVDLYKDGVKTGESKNIPKSEFVAGNGSKDITFEGVDKTDENGNTYNYDIKVSEDNELAEGFTIDDDGNLVYTPPMHTVEATVRYIGGDTLREEVIVKLKRSVDGTTETASEKTVYVNEFNGDGLATVNFDDMPKTNAEGKTYTYSIETSDVDNFNKTNEGLTATYSYVEDYVDVPVHIIWNGGANASKPENITIKLNNGNTEVGSKTVSSSATEVVFSGMPIRDANNGYQDIDYTVQADEVNNFTKSIDNDSKTVTYTYVAPRGTVTVPVRKTGGEPIEVVVELIKDGAQTGRTQTVMTGSNSSWDNTELTNSDGDEINYTIKIDRDNTNLPDGYTIVTDGEGNDSIQYTSPKISFTKTVPQSGGKPIEVTVKLTRDGQIVSGSDKTAMTGSDVTWDDLDKTDAQGNDYNYDMIISGDTELPDGYAIEVDSDGNMQIVYTSPKQMLEITKKWVDGEEKRPDSITVVIKQNGNTLREVVITKEEHKTEDNKWVIEVEVDKTDSNANDYTYSVEERLVEGFTPEYAQDGLSITNTYVIPKKTLKAQIAIDGPTDNLPTLTIQLKDEEGNVVQEKEATVANGILEATFEDVPVTDSNGKDIDYSFDLKDVPDNYNVIIVDGVIKLTYVSPKVYIEVPITIPDEVTGDIEIELIRNGESTGITKTVNAEDVRAGGGKVTFENVDKTDSNGNDYNYTGNIISEIPGYKVVTDSNGNVQLIYTGEPKDIVITTSYIGGESVTRETIKVNILRDGEVVKSVDVKNTETIVSNMPTYDKNGHEYVYTLGITNVEDLKNKNFEATVIGPKNIKMEYIVPKGTKTFDILWQGLGSSGRPEITVALLSNGSRTDKTAILRNGENKVTFDNLPLTDKSGKEIKYGIDIIKIPEGFIKTISASGNSIVLTKEITNQAYIPHTGVKENFTVGIILILVILYSRKNLRRASANASVKGATKRSFRK